MEDYCNWTFQNKDISAHGHFSKGALVLKCLCWNVHVLKYPCAEISQCCEIPVPKRPWCRNIPMPKYSCIKMSACKKVPVRKCLCRNISCQNVRCRNKPKSKKKFLDLCNCNIPNMTQKIIKKTFRMIR